MSRPLFLADHDLNEHIVAGVLRCEPTIKFLRVRDLGMGKRSDQEILEYADREELLVVSHDVNTMPAVAYDRLLAGQSFPGLFMVPQTVPVGLAIENLVLVWAASELDDWENQVVFLPFQ